MFNNLFISFLKKNSVRAIKANTSSKSTMIEKILISQDEVVNSKFKNANKLPVEITGNITNAKYTPVNMIGIATVP
jgi:hypothetical protein